MRILYLAEGYLNSEVHHNLAQSLSEYSKDNEIFVFSSLRKPFSIEDSKNKYGKYSYSYLYKNVDISHFLYKFNFWAKRKSKLRGLLKSVDIKTIDFVIASTLFSDGAVALEIYKKFNIPYIVSIRDTDISTYLKTTPHLWLLCSKIIDKSSHLIFISESLKRRFTNSFVTKIFFNIKEKKLSVIPNGINKYFIDNKVIHNKKSNSPKQFLYIGEFIPRKNVISLIKAFLLIQKEYPNIILNLVGGGGKKKNNQEKDIFDFVNKNNNINFIGKIKTKEKLVNLIRDNDVFIMVSHTETFGLVYIEALSQGLPIIYTKGQGVDGFFDDIKIGEKADSKSIDSIYNAMKKIIEDYPSYENIGERINLFTWENNSKMIMNNIDDII